jgi:hypothetical protein
MKERSATISPCGLYRYDLIRRWPSPGGMLVNFIGLNPSTADAEQDDPTIRKCCEFARRWGYDGIVMTNLFAFRATDPRAMRQAVDPVGPENNARLLHWSRVAALVVVAWGNHGAFRDRGNLVTSLLNPPAYCLRLTKAGQPEHPLYLPYSTPRQPFKTLHV